MTDTATSSVSSRAGLHALLLRADPKYFITFLITLVLVVGEYRYAILGGYDRLLAALLTCTGTELALSRLLRGKVANLQSAYITGISLSLLLKPQAGLHWPFVLGGFLAIGSKYVLQYRNQHLWNPSNFAIGLLLLAAPDRVAVLSHQWGNDLATNAVIWVFGLLIASRVRVLHVTLTYVGCFLLLAALRSWIQGTLLLPEIAPITGPMYQLFIFFMITDPRTTVGTRRGRMLVVALVAVAEAAVRVAADHHLDLPRAFYASPPILALAVVGPVAKWLDLRRATASASSGSATRPAGTGVGLTPPI